MKAAYKWRIQNGLYAYITDEIDKGLFVYNTKTYEREYEDGTVETGSSVNDGTIASVVSKMTKQQYIDHFNTFKNFMNKNYPDVSLLDVSYYYNIENDECSASAGSLKCASTDIIFRVSGVTIGDNPDVILEAENTNPTNGDIVYNMSFVIPATVVSGESITFTSVTANTLVTSSITADNITVNEINVTNVTTENLTANTIVVTSATINELNTSAITASSITVSSITAGDITVSSITASSITAGDITASSITVSGSVIADSFVKSGGTGDEYLMADGSVTRLSAGTNIELVREGNVVIINSTASGGTGGEYEEGRNIRITSDNKINAEGYIHDSAMTSFATAGFKDSGARFASIHNAGDGRIRYNDSEPNDLLVGDMILMNNYTYTIKSFTSGPETINFNEQITDENIQSGTTIYKLVHNIASGDYSFAEGYLTQSFGNYGSHAEGYWTIAQGAYGSHAEGNKSKALGDGSHAEGKRTTAQGKYSHSEGGVALLEQDKLPKLSKLADLVETLPDGSPFKIKVQSLIDNHFNYYYTDYFKIENGHAFITDGGAYIDVTKSVYNPEIPTQVYLSYAIAADNNYESVIDEWINDGIDLYYVYKRTSKSLGEFSHTEGSQTEAIGISSHAEGCRTVSSGEFSHTGGYCTEANLPYMVAFGCCNKTGSTDELFVVGNGSLSLKKVTTFEGYFEKLPRNALTVHSGGTDTVTATVNGVDDVYLGLPIGSITMWAGSGSSVPSGWLLCTGGTISVTEVSSGEEDFSWVDGQLTKYLQITSNDNEYDNIGKVIKGIYGVVKNGNTITGILLPDLQQRFPLGSGSGTIGKNGTSSSGWPIGVGSTGGTDLISQSEIPALDVKATLRNQAHYVENKIYTETLGYSRGLLLSCQTNNYCMDTSIVKTDGSDGNAHNNIPPFLALNFIIKYK